MEKRTWRPAIKNENYDAFVYQSSCDRYLLVGEYESGPKGFIKRTIKVIDLERKREC